MINATTEEPSIPPASDSFTKSNTWVREGICLQTRVNHLWIQVSSRTADSPCLELWTDTPELLSEFSELVDIKGLKNISGQRKQEQCMIAITDNKTLYIGCLVVHKAFLHPSSLLVYHHQSLIITPDSQMKKLRASVAPRNSLTLPEFHCYSQRRAAQNPCHLSLNSAYLHSCDSTPQICLAPD